MSRKKTSDQKFFSFLFHKLTPAVALDLDLLNRSVLFYLHTKAGLRINWTTSHFPEGGRGCAEWRARTLPIRRGEGIPT